MTCRFPKQWAWPADAHSKRLNTVRF